MSGFYLESGEVRRRAMLAKVAEDSILIAGSIANGYSRVV